jgi:hypothetical protein
MARGQHRQVTPAGSRIIWIGLLATIGAMLVNYGWLWILTNTFHSVVEVPSTPGSTTLSALTNTRVLIATGVAGVLATLGAWLLGRLVIGPRIWILVLGSTLGIASLVSVNKIAGLGLVAKFELAIFHILSSVILVGALYLATKISQNDVLRAQDHNQQIIDGIQVDAPNFDEAQQAQIDTAMNLAPGGMGDIANLNETLVMPLTNNTDTVIAFDPLTMMGQPEATAVAQLRAAGYDIHVVLRDGQMFEEPASAVANRVKISIAGGVITRVEVG